jgi:hypothetical protein
MGLKQGNAVRRWKLPEIDTTERDEFDIVPVSIVWLAFDA